MLPADAWDSSQAELVHWEVSNRFLSFRSSLCTQLIVTSLLFACLPWGALEKWKKDQNKRKKEKNRGGGPPDSALRCFTRRRNTRLARRWSWNEPWEACFDFCRISPEPRPCQLSLLAAIKRPRWRRTRRPFLYVANRSACWPHAWSGLHTHTHTKHPTQNNKTNNKLTPHHRQLSCWL